MDKTPFYKGVSTDEKHVESHSLEFVRSSSLKCSQHQTITVPVPPRMRGGLKRESH